MKLDEYLWRHRKEITRAKFAKKVGMNLMSLWRLMEGEHEPKVSRALKIVEATNGEVTLQDLIIEEREQNEDHEKDQKSSHDQLISGL